MSETGYKTRQGYIDRVTRGEGFMPWQERERACPDEVQFRKAMELRKDEMLSQRTAVAHPVLITDEQIDRARRNVDETRWGEKWFRDLKRIADHVVAQPDGYVERMIPELTPTNPYGLTCPNCVGVSSQEGLAYRSIRWDYRDPETVRCAACGQTYPDPEFPETIQLVCPRRQQTFTYCASEAERAHPEDRSGTRAWKWVGKPVHSSFTGYVRAMKIGFIASAANRLSLCYRLTGKASYAQTALRILLRLSECYPNWLYHDFYDTIADCDPLYAAWHFMELKLEWKRHLSGMAYGDSRYETGPVDDTFDCAKMLATYFGSGRIHPSVDGISSNLGAICRAYDGIQDATNGDGSPLLSEQSRGRIEKGLILEYLLTAERFVGGTGDPPDLGNKSPSVYQAQSTVGRCLGLPGYVDAALRGYEGLRDRSFLDDGFSKESPAYTNMYLSNLIWIPETLHGFRWPEEYEGRKGTVDLYGADPKLRAILRAALDQLRPDGCYLPLSDTAAETGPTAHIFEIGAKRYPGLFAGTLPGLYRGGSPSEYAVFNLDEGEVTRGADLGLPEILFPAWMTAILRHGFGADASVLALPFNPPGGHRQTDNLSLYYFDRGRVILGEQGYVGDSPMNAWVRGTTLSHNLVVVDDANQRLGAEGEERRPRLHFMAASPHVSVVEASSEVYPQCTDYRRTVALLKGPGAETIALDIFRVKGGDKHAYRLFSEIGASDSENGRIEFPDLDMPPEPPMPNYGSSVDPEHIFGLRDIRHALNPPTSWRADWKQAGRRYRLRVLSQVDSVEASHGPGQESIEQIGRRVRFLDAITVGDDLSSTFVALHEPGGPSGSMPVRRARQLPLPSRAGPDAVAVRLLTKWGTYWVFSDVEAEIEVAGIRFQGAFGIWLETQNGEAWHFAVGASTLARGEAGFSGISPSWNGGVVDQTDRHMISDRPAPEGWAAPPDGTAAWVAVDTETYRTGYPVRSTEGNRIVVDRFPLQPVSRFELPSVQCGRHTLE